MIEKLLTIENIDVYFVIGIILFFSLLESISGFLKNSKRAKGDWIQEIMSFVVLGNLIKPIIVFVIFITGTHLFPQYNNSLGSYPFIVLFAFTYLQTIFFNIGITGPHMKLRFYGNYIDLIIKQKKWGISFHTETLYYIIY